MILPIILAGGTGTRLWPLSRELDAKQLLPLIGRLSMIQATVKRLTGIPDLAPPLLICNESHRFMVAEQLRAMGVATDIMIEPIGRNTAPAIAAAAIRICWSCRPTIISKRPKRFIGPWRPGAV